MRPARSRDLARPLDFFALETTGTDVGRDQIVEIAVLKRTRNGRGASHRAYGRICRAFDGSLSTLRLNAVNTPAAT
jgi:hypothetical protein